MRRLAAGAVLLVTLAGCSTSLESKRAGDHCLQVREKKVFGITYSSAEYRVNCASQ